MDGIIGKKFNRLTILDVYKNDSGQLRAICKCDCGEITEKYRGNVTTGRTHSCGCSRREGMARRSMEAGTSAGMSNTPEFVVWCNMRRRCTDPKNKAYHNYGGRGIRVCDSWLNRFDAFYADMGPRPSKNHSLERKDVNGGYSKDNCIWVTQQDQTRNRRPFGAIGYSGITFDTKRNQFVVKIGLDYKDIFVGRFNELLDAIAARQKAEMKYWNKVYTKYPMTVGANWWTGEK